MTASRPLVDALDAAIAASQETTAQLVRARTEVLRLVDEAIDEYEAEQQRDPVPYKDYLPEDPDIWMTAENINDARPPMRGAR